MVFVLLCFILSSSCHSAFDCVVSKVAVNILKLGLGCLAGLGTICSIRWEIELDVMFVCSPDLTGGVEIDFDAILTCQKNSLFRWLFWSRKMHINRKHHQIYINEITLMVGSSDSPLTLKGIAHFQQTNGPSL